MSIPRVAIACQGGGSYAAFGAGILSRLLEPELSRRFPLVALSGTSGGSMTAALLWRGLVGSGERWGERGRHGPMVSASSRLTQTRPLGSIESRAWHDDPVSERPGKYQRSFSGLVAAMAVLLLVVVGFVVFRGSFRDNQQVPVKAVDYAASLPFIREKATFPVLAPPSLPEGWRATSIRFEEARPQSFHLGVLTDEDEYLGIEQARDGVAEMVDEFVDDEATKGDEAEVAGKTWTTYTDEGGDVALVRREAGVTILVVGTVTGGELRAYVETLQVN